MDSENAKITPPALVAIAIGVDPFAMRLLREALPGVDFREVPMNIVTLLKTENEKDPDLIFCGRLHVDVDLTDLAQAVRSVFADPPLYYVCSEREGFDQQALAKNGFADAFLMPMDKGILRSLVPDGSAGYQEVPLIEISPDTVLNFDTYIYLPVNRKFIRFTSSGYPLSGPRAKRLFDHEVRNVYISQDQLAAYVKFTAGQLKKIDSTENTTPTEKRKLMHKAVRSLLSGLLSENAAVMDFSAIVKTYILENSPEPSPLYERMLNFTGSVGDSYSHVSNVSALAALFSMGLGIGKPEEIALAGLLHDIGLADIPVEIQEKEEHERSESDQLIYRQHPNIALQIIKKRQIELSTRILKMIEQHHERWNARGYPNELRGKDIMPESQILALADEFEYATQARPGNVRASARAATEKLLQHPGFDPDILNGLAKLLGMEKSEEPA